MIPTTEPVHLSPTPGTQLSNLGISIPTCPSPPVHEFSRDPTSKIYLKPITLYLLYCHPMLSPDFLSGLGFPSCPPSIPCPRTALVKCDHIGHLCSNLHPSTNEPRAAQDPVTAVTCMTERTTLAPLNSMSGLHQPPSRTQWALPSQSQSPVQERHLFLLRAGSPLPGPSSPATSSQGPSLTNTQRGVAPATPA